MTYISKLPEKVTVMEEKERLYEKIPFEQIFTSDGLVTSGIVQNLMQQLQQLNDTVQRQVQIIDTMNATMERQEKTIDELRGLQRVLVTHSNACCNEKW